MKDKYLKFCVKYPETVVNNDIGINVVQYLKDSNLELTIDFIKVGNLIETYNKYPKIFTHLSNLKDDWNNLISEEEHEDSELISSLKQHLNDTPIDKLKEEWKSVTDMFPDNDEIITQSKIDSVNSYLDGSVYKQSYEEGFFNGVQWIIKKILKTNCEKWIK